MFATGGFKPAAMAARLVSARGMGLHENAASADGPCRHPASNGATGRQVRPWRNPGSGWPAPAALLLVVALCIPASAWACAAIESLEAHRARVPAEFGWYQQQAVETVIGEGDILGRCRNEASKPITPFSMHLAVAPGGGLGVVLLRPETEFGLCIKRLTENRIFALPPRDEDFPVRLDHLSLDAVGMPVLESITQPPILAGTPS